MQSVLQSRTFRPLVAFVVVVGAYLSQPQEASAQRACPNMVSHCILDCETDAGDNGCSVMPGHEYCVAASCSWNMSCSLFHPNKVICGASSGGEE